MDAEMKRWSKFFIVPLISLFILSIFFSLVDVQYSSNSMLSISAIAIQFLSFIIVPFSMLRLAPVHSYLATLIYMTVLWILMYLGRFVLNNESLLQDGLSLLWGGVFWTMAAMAIYFFYFDSHFQMSTGKKSSRSGAIK